MTERWWVKERKRVLLSAENPQVLGDAPFVRGRRLTMQVWKRIGDGKPVLNMPRTPCITTVDSNKTVL